MTTQPATSNRSWAYGGALLGGAVSIAANVAHSYVPPIHATAGWQPPTGAVVSAIFWPLALFVAIEILARTVWPSGRRWAALRFLGLLPVAVVAAVVSYRHLSGLLAFYREDGLTAVIGPLAVDGLMVMATGALIAAGRHRTPATAAPAPAEPSIPTEPATPISSTAEEPPVPAEPTPVPVKPTSAARKRTPKRQPSAAERVAAAIARSPKASDATIAARLKLSEKTVQRHRRQAVDNVSTPSQASRADLRAV
jgi:DNA-binding CsgD family transcriptional regulator